MNQPKKVSIKHLRPNERICYRGVYEDEVYTVFGNPWLNERGTWSVDVTDSGDYCFVFDEGDEKYLFYEE